MTDQITIKKGLKLGELDAESDEALLSTCFIDNGIIDRLVSVEAHASIVLGRTGSGKSALLHHISKTASFSTLLDPNDISIRFLEHSNIIQFFTELGIKLDLFYRILWRHILTVELLKLRYELNSEAEGRSFVSRVSSWVQRDAVKKRSVEYFTEWGEKFWLETDEHLRELTEKFTRDVKAKLGVKYQAIDISGEGARSLTKEVRTEITSLATQVVSAIQIKRLNEVLDLLAENAFQDRQKSYYILIDKLDEDWAETETRCRFIRALVEETKCFRRIPQVKIITALRRDLLDLVFDSTRGSGFQEEKYEAYLAPVSWVDEDLHRLLSSRVKEIYKRQYTSNDVEFTDVFPTRPKHGNPAAIDYLIERTLMRPRDAIQFANQCFAHAEGRPRISWRSIFAAEATYSTKRLLSLSEEWSDYYPALGITIELLRGLPTPFTRSAITSQRILEICAQLCERDYSGPCAKLANELYQAKSRKTESDFLSEALRCLYHVGAIGIKISTLDTCSWSHMDQPRLTLSEVKRANQIHIHKMLRHTLETRTSDKKAEGQI